MKYSLLLRVANFLNIKKNIKTTNYYTLNLPSRSRAVAMLFQALSLAILSLYDFLLRLYITGKLRTQSINFSSNSPMQLMVYKKHNCREQATTLLVCCHKTVRRHAEVKDRLPQPHDAAASAQCHGGTLMSATLKNQPPSKPQL